MRTKSVASAQINTGSPRRATKPLSFTAATNLYYLGDRATRNDILDQLSIQIERLESLLMMTSGEQGESFRRMNDKLQGSYLDACAAIATECHDLVSHLHESTEMQYEHSSDIINLHRADGARL